MGKSSRPARDSETSGTGTESSGEESDGGKPEKKDGTSKREATGPSISLPTASSTPVLSTTSRSDSDHSSLRRRTLSQVVKDLSVSTSSMLETVSEFNESGRVLEIPILDAGREPHYSDISDAEDTPEQQTGAEVQPAIYLDPAEFPPNTSVHAVPTVSSQEVQTDGHLRPDDALIVFPHQGGLLQLSPFMDYKSVLPNQD